MKFILTILFLITPLALLANEESKNTSKITTIENIIKLNFKHSLKFFINNAKIKSPILWEKKTIPNFWVTAGKSLPTIGYSRSYGSGGNEFTDENYNVSFDISKIMNNIEQRNNLIEKNNFNESNLLRKISELYSHAITLEEVYLQMKELHSIKKKILSKSKTMFKKGGIGEYKITELKLEIVETGLKISNTKNELIKTLIELHYIAGIKIVY